jgi:alpha-glucosidase
MVDFYWKTAACAAKHHLFVDFHGTFKPIGIRRSYPNVLSFEGVVGEEHYKWQAAPMPDNNVMIPYIRNVAGPMDYTPGGMLNTTAKTFVISYSHPRVIGTRTNELAKYIVYVSPLQMLADSPTNYLKNPKSTEFISQIPTVWDTTVALAGQVGKYVVVARRRGKRWYLGAMNGLSPREIHIKLSFLPEGQYRMKFFADVRESNQIATAYQTGVKQVTSDSVLNIYMAWGGGFAAIFQRIDR